MNGLFPLVSCTRCQMERLAFVELVGEALVQVCAACGATGEVSRLVDDSTLSAQGLCIKASAAIESAQAKKRGCSKGSCGTGGGCSTGRGCGSCSSGGCGTKIAAQLRPA